VSRWAPGPTVRGVKQDTVDNEAPLAAVADPPIDDIIRQRPSLRSWERDLAALRTGDAREIPRHLRAELDRLRRRLVMTLTLIREREDFAGSAL
jgi:hypothetical protein